MNVRRKGEGTTGAESNGSSARHIFTASKIYAVPSGVPRVFPFVHV